MRSIVEQFREQLAESEGSDRNFVLLIAAVLLAAGVLPASRHGAAALRWWAVIASGVLVLIALIAPEVFRWPKRAWLFLGFLLGLVVNPVVIGLLFLLIVTPAGLLMRRVGRDSLRLRPQAGLTTYWQTRTAAPSDMRDQF